MGEIADSMLDGTLCEECGVYIATACGFPRKCDDCKPKRRRRRRKRRKDPPGGER